jgi:mono/diheme cytochrome c family protein
MVGYGGAAATSASIMLKDRPRLPGRLMVFKLGGKATAKAYVIPEIPPLDLTQVVAGKGDVKNGFALYHENCQVCHGPSVSGTYLPDLKKSQMLLTADSFKSVMLDGALASRGMASFSRFLNEKEVEDLRAYILTETRKSQTRTAVAAPAAPRG